MPRKILVTSALPYANGPIHLGHLAKGQEQNLWDVPTFRFLGTGCLGSPRDCGSTTSAFLKELKGLDPLFEKWHLSGDSKGGESGRRVSGEAKRLSDLFAMNGMRDDTFKQRPEWGYSLYLYNTLEDGTCVFLEFSGLGGDRQLGWMSRFSNKVFLRFSLRGTTKSRLRRRPLLLAVAQCLVNHFKPDHGCLETKESTALMPDDYRGARIGWLTYFGREYDLSRVPRSVRVVSDGGHGAFIWTTATPIDSDNPTHRTAFTELFQSMRPQIEMDLQPAVKQQRRRSS